MISLYRTHIYPTKVWSAEIPYLAVAYHTRFSTAVYSRNRASCHEKKFPPLRVEPMTFPMNVSSFFLIG